MNFHNECRSIRHSEADSFAEEIRKENWSEEMVKDKDSVRRLQADLEAYKSRRQKFEAEEANQENYDAIFDQKLTVTNFISTVLSYA